jgi:lipid-binding SYLF domain-containing protein
LSFDGKKEVSMPIRSLCVLFTSVLWLAAGTVQADNKAEIDAKVQASLVKLRSHAAGSDALLAQAAGVLVFPDVVKMGFGVGGQHGEGALLVGGKPVAYYSTSGGAYGLQLGALYKSEVILFMTAEALQGFRAAQEWTVGADGAVPVVKVAAGGRVDAAAVSGPTAGIIFSNKGLVPGLALDGGKFTQIAR